MSSAGLRKGMSRESGTRSGMLWQVERILLELSKKGQLPQILVMENVPQVHTGDNIEPFNDWLQTLQKLGYTSYDKDLNAKRYGIPQNRNRCFMVSILGETSYTFPDPIKLKHRLKDFLDKGPVDEKYYLSEETVSGFIAHNENGEEAINKNVEKMSLSESTSKTICATQQKTMPETIPMSHYGKRNDER